MASDGWNDPRALPGRRGLYEAYYLRFHDPQTRTGHWLRYTLRSPPRGSGDAVAETWAFFWPPMGKGPAVGAKHTARAADARLSRAPLRFELGDSRLVPGHAVGRVAGGDLEIAWDLTWDAGPEAVRLYPFDAMYRNCLSPSTKLVAPAWDTRFHGTVDVNEESYRVRDAPGEQGHVWGARHAEAWSWAHCNAFDGADACVEALTASPRGGRALSLLRVRVGARVSSFTGLLDLFRTRSEPSLGRWTLAARKGGAEARVEFTAPPAQYVGATYEDPSGRRLVCDHSEAADCRLEISDPGRGLPRTVLLAHGSAAVEHAGRSASPGVRVVV